MSQFLRGFLAPFRSGRFLFRHPRLLKYILIPFVVNVLVFSLAVGLGLDFFNDTVVARLPSGEAWYWLLLTYFLWIVAVVVTAVLVFFSFTVVGNLLSAPFNDLLSERTEQIVLGAADEKSFSLRGFWQDALRTVVEEGKRLLVFVAGMVLILLLNLVPVVGTVVYAVLSILFTMFFLAVEYTGFVFGRKPETFRDQRRFILSRKLLMLGFAAGVTALLAIPFLQFFCIPLAVVGATRLWCSEVSGEGQDR